ncbi:hypothetical protein NM688_g6350 [Phlebia brevispora]|uniref:Uncharacterized protein n=1 Tax=Phlebia brevispora TaxID=194682 RepID=A0ACC1SH81_9APHY|nr:hypothetical protein NM688_g6350 [Phlebia brevispora]
MGGYKDAALTHVSVARRVHTTHSLPRIVTHTPRIIAPSPPPSTILIGPPSPILSPSPPPVQPIRHRRIERASGVEPLQRMKEEPTRQLVLGPSVANRLLPELLPVVVECATRYFHPQDLILLASTCRQSRRLCMPPLFEIIRVRRSGDYINLVKLINDNPNDNAAVLYTRILILDLTHAKVPGPLGQLFVTQCHPLYQLSTVVQFLLASEVEDRQLPISIRLSDFRLVIFPLQNLTHLECRQVSWSVQDTKHIPSSISRTLRWDLTPRNAQLSKTFVQAAQYGEEGKQNFIVRFSKKAGNVSGHVIIGIGHTHPALHRCSGALRLIKDDLVYMQINVGLMTPRTPDNSDPASGGVISIIFVERSLRGLRTTYDFKVLVDVLETQLAALTHLESVILDLVEDDVAHIRVSETSCKGMCPDVNIINGDLRHIRAGSRGKGMSLGAHCTGHLKLSVLECNQRGTKVPARTCTFWDMGGNDLVSSEDKSRLKNSCGSSDSDLASPILPILPATTRTTWYYESYDSESLSSLSTPLWIRSSAPDGDHILHRRVEHAPSIETLRHTSKQVPTGQPNLSPSAAGRLPPELLPVVVECATRDFHPQDLMSLASTCHLSRRLCMPTLFEIIRLRSSKKIIKLIKMINNNPKSDVRVVLLYTRMLILDLTHTATPVGQLLITQVKHGLPNLLTLSFHKVSQAVQGPTLAPHHSIVRSISSRLSLNFCSLQNLRIDSCRFQLLSDFCLVIFPLQNLTHLECRQVSWSVQDTQNIPSSISRTLRWDLTLRNAQFSKTFVRPVQYGEEGKQNFVVRFSKKAGNVSGHVIIGIGHTHPALHRCSGALRLIKDDLVYMQINVGFMSRDNPDATSGGTKSIIFVDQSLNDLKITYDFQALVDVLENQLAALTHLESVILDLEKDDVAERDLEGLFGPTTCTKAMNPEIVFSHRCASSSAGMAGIIPQMAISAGDSPEANAAEEFSHSFTCRTSLSTDASGSKIYYYTFLDVHASCRSNSVCATCDKTFTSSLLLSRTRHCTCYTMHGFDAARIYANELSRYLGLLGGYPLWYPDPGKEREVQIGDVGYITEGRFKPLFNVISGLRRDGEDSEEAKKLDKFTCMSYNSRSEDFRPGYLQPKSYESKSVKIVKGQGELGTLAGGGSTQLECSFECSKRQGAILHLKHEADKRSVPINERIKKYLKQHYSTWEDTLEREFDGRCTLDQLVFVHGWVKTSQWGVAAFWAKEESSSASIQASFNSIANAGLHFDLHKQENMHYFHHTGPRSARSEQSAHSKHATVNARKDQCIFLRTFKVQRRHWFVVLLMRANAGPAPLPDRPPDEDAVAVHAYESYTEEGVSEPCEYPDLPLDALLFYIFTGDDKPSDLAAYLRDIKPRIEVDEEKVGTLSLEYLVLRNQQRRCGLQAQHHIHEESYKSSQAVGNIILSGGKTLRWVDHVFDHGPAKGATINATSVSRDGKYILTGGTGHGFIVLWDQRTGDRIWEFPVGTDSIISVAFSPDAKRFVSGFENTNALLWDVENPDTPPSSLQHDDWVLCVAWSSDGETIATASLGQTVSMWNKDGTKRFTQSYQGQVTAMEFSPDGKHLLVGVDLVAYLWSCQTGEQRALDGHNALIWTMKFSRQSDRIATGSDDHTVRLWDAKNGDGLIEIRVHTSEVSVVDFSPDGRYIASSSSNGTIAVCDVLDGEAKFIMGYEEDPVPINGLAYSNSGGYMVSGDAKGMVRLWDAESGEFIAEFRGHGGRVKTVEWTPDDAYVWSFSDDGTVRGWSVRDVLRFDDRS